MKAKAMDAAEKLGFTEDDLAFTEANKANFVAICLEAGFGKTEDECNKLVDHHYGEHAKHAEEAATLAQKGGDKPEPTEEQKAAKAEFMDHCIAYGESAEDCNTYFPIFRDFMHKCMTDGGDVTTCAASAEAHLIEKLGGDSSTATEGPTEEEKKAFKAEFMGHCTEHATKELCETEIFPEFHKKMEECMNNPDINPENCLEKVEGHLHEKYGGDDSTATDGDKREGGEKPADLRKEFMGHCTEWFTPEECDGYFAIFEGAMHECMKGEGADKETCLDAAEDHLFHIDSSSATQ